MPEHFSGGKFLIFERYFRFEYCWPIVIVISPTSGPLILAVTTAAQSSRRTCPLRAKELFQRFGLGSRSAEVVFDLRLNDKMAFELTHFIATDVFRVRVTS